MRGFLQQRETLRGAQGRRPSEDRGRDWSDASRRLRCEVSSERLACPEEQSRSLGELREGVCACVCSCSVALLCSSVCSPPGSSVRGISQPRIVEWVAMSSSRGSSRPGSFLNVPVLSPGISPCAQTPGRTGTGLQKRA